MFAANQTLSITKNATAVVIKAAGSAAQVVAADMMAARSVVHVISEVLIPAGFSLLPPSTTHAPDRGVDVTAEPAE